ncbi:hypothetical protein IPF89_00640 [Candidatus Saccharibacteria bacterium]|nr:MAG: hypothetical protein IPF89_00640 [Candidatus Saccharibacteria bacterium]
MTDARTTTGFAALSMDELLERRANAMLAMSGLETKLRQLMRRATVIPKLSTSTASATLSWNSPCCITSTKSWRFATGPRYAKIRVVEALHHAAPRKGRSGHQFV